MKQQLSRKTLKEGINDTENTKVGTNGQTWRRFKRMEIVSFWKPVSLTVFQYIFIS